MTMKDIKEIAAELLNNSTMVCLDQGKLGCTRQVKRKKKDDALAGNGITDEGKKRMKLGQELFVSKEYKAIVNFQQAVRKTIEARCVPSFLKETFWLVSNQAIEALDVELQGLQTKLDEELVPAFIAVYPEEVERGRLAFGDLFVEDNYCPVEYVQEKFRLDYGFFSFQVGSSLPREVREREEKKLQESTERACVEISNYLREGFKEVLDSIVERVTSKNSKGEQKAFHNTVFDNLVEFIQSLPTRNIVKDGELDKLVLQAEGILSEIRGNNPREKGDTLKEAEELKASVIAQFRVLSDSIEVGSVNRRKFNFD